MEKGKKTKRSEEDEEDEDNEDEEEGPTPKQPATSSVNIAEPLFFWIIVLVLALFSKVVITSTTTFVPSSQAYAFLNSISTFFLFNSGSLILPLVVGAVIGAEVGLKSKTLYKALKAGILNGVYAAIIYVIAIVIIYEVLLYIIPQSGVTTTFLVNNLVLPQVVILIVLVEIFAALSHSRKITA